MARASREAAGRGAARTPPAIVVRPVRRADLDRVIEIDATVTRLPKADYWRSLYRRYGTVKDVARHFLVAEADRRVVGYVIGEIRDWEFGSPPCGWVFAISVDPRNRLAGVGAQLLAEIAVRFRQRGANKLRTMLSRDNTLILSFFRSQGMMAAPFIPLELDA